MSLFFLFPRTRNQKMRSIQTVTPRCERNRMMHGTSMSDYLALQRLLNAEKQVRKIRKELNRALKNGEKCAVELAKKLFDQQQIVHRYENSRAV